MANGMLCPHCALTVSKNQWGDLVCPNCGIIKQHEEDSKEIPSYLG